MVGFNQAAQRFLKSYEQQYEQYILGATRLRDLVRKVTRNSPALVHTVTARAKTPESVSGKIRRKGYSDPDRQLTDLIGVRVVTYYHDDVGPIVDRMRAHFDIDASESIDKRVQLGLSEFGYRSVQLIARLKSRHASTPNFRVLKERWFEIQVRSILEHAWAEIEHEILYKSGVEYPEEIVRRFASLAGTLELLDNEFLALRHARNELIDRYRETYARKEDDQKPFDVARLLGFLEASRPSGQSWRQAKAAGEPFHTGLETSCVDALEAVGLNTPKSLKSVFRSGKFRSAVSSFADVQGATPESVSHLAVVVLALVVTDADLIRQRFPELVFDPAIEQMAERRQSK